MGQERPLSPYTKEQLLETGRNITETRRGFLKIVNEFDIEHLNSILDLADSGNGGFDVIDGDALDETSNAWSEDFQKLGRLLIKRIKLVLKIDNLAKKIERKREQINTIHRWIIQ